MTTIGVILFEKYYLKQKFLYQVICAFLGYWFLIYIESHLRKKKIKNKIEN